MAADGATGLRRGLAALAVLADADGAGRGGLGVLDVARRLGVDKSQASRTLRALAEEGLAERDPATRAFRLGPRVFAYAAVVSERRVLRSAPALLERLVATLGERAHLSVLDGPRVLTLVTESPPLAVQAAGWPGRTVPAYCTAAGRALLADHDEARLTALLGTAPLERRASNTPASIAEVAARIAIAAGRGYEVADEELEPGLCAVAAAVRRFDGRIVAAVNVSGPAFRFAPRLDAAGAEVAAAAAGLASQLQSTPPAVAMVAT